MSKSQRRTTPNILGSWSVVLCWSLVLGHSLPGCSGYTGPRSVVNEDPAVKIPEIHKAVDRGDKRVQPQLVADLDSNDAAVRFYAIEALARFNDGERLDYDWKVADRHERRPAIEAWKKKLGIDTPAVSPTTGESP